MNRLSRALIIAGWAWTTALAAQAKDSFPTAPPKPAPLAPARFPPFKESALPNGVNVIVIERHDVPIVSASLSFYAGDVYDPAGKEGLSAFVAELLTKGTKTRTAEQIASTIEGVGGSLSASSGDDFLTISGEALSDHVSLLFDLLGDVTRSSTFPDAELALARTRQLSALALELSEPGSVASRMFRRDIYGTNPYGRSATEQSYRAITVRDVADFAQRYIRPRGALLVVAGDITPGAVDSLAKSSFNGWQGAPPATPAPVSGAVARANDILLVHRPGSAQSNVLVGNTTILPTDSLYYAGRVVTQVLGGGADSRLFRVLREEQSWTYDAHSALRRMRGLGYWVASVEVRTSATDSALHELLHQIDIIRTQPVPEAELAATKGYLVGSFPLSIETASQIGSQVATAKLLGLGPDYLRLFRERLAAVTPGQAQRAASRLYHEGAFSIVVAGDGAQLYPKLKAMGQVRIVDLQGNPLTPDDLVPRAGPLPLDPAQLVSHRDSFSVLLQGQPFGWRTTALRRTADSLVYVESMNLGNTGAQQIRLVFDPQTLEVRSLVETGSVGGQKNEANLDYSNGRVTGRAVVPQESGQPKSLTIDTTITPGTYDDNAVNVIVPALPLSVGKTYPLRVFSSGDGTSKVLTVTVTASDSVRVPAGAFQAFKVEVTGGQAPFVLWVGGDTPRRVVKLEVVGAPIEFQLVK
ncbi:MAG TPA: insulinase family protein [Gemmatimonadales bacterium]|nr:insulinase family protein [Gemmatimonadales bacterium]